MRMWDLDPRILCRKHLLGEHVEMHMFVGTINNNIKIEGYLKNNLLDVKKIKERHDLLVKEMNNRGYNHKSELKDINRDFTIEEKSYNIDKNKSLDSLIYRCNECMNRYQKIINEKKGDE